MSQTTNPVSIYGIRGVCRKLGARKMLRIRRCASCCSRPHVGHGGFRAAFKYSRISIKSWEIDLKQSCLDIYFLQLITSTFFQWLNLPTYYTCPIFNTCRKVLIFKIARPSPLVKNYTVICNDKTATTDQSAFAFPNEINWWSVMMPCRRQNNKITIWICYIKSQLLFFSPFTFLGKMYDHFRPPCYLSSCK